MFNARPYHLAILAAWQLHRQKPLREGKTSKFKRYTVHTTLLVENPSDVQSHIIIEQQQAPIPTTRPFRCPASALGHLHRHVAASFPIPPCARTLELAAVHPGKATCQVIRGSKP